MTKLNSSIQKDIPGDWKLDALPPDMKNFLCNRSFIRQDPFDPYNPDPVRRTTYHHVETRLYSSLNQE